MRDWLIGLAILAGRTALPARGERRAGPENIEGGDRAP
jgi:hypothetical protein